MLHVERELPANAISVDVPTNAAGFVTYGSIDAVLSEDSLGNSQIYTRESRTDGRFENGYRRAATQEVHGRLERHTGHPTTPGKAAFVGRSGSSIF